MATKRSRSGEFNVADGSPMSPDDHEEVQDLKFFNIAFIGSQIVGFLAVVLVAVWTAHHLGGFAWQSNPALQFNWHPLFMVSGLVYLYGQSIMVYRALRRETKQRLKLTHAFLHSAVIICVMIALKAVFDSHDLHDPPIPNLYSLHSWMGLTTEILFATQYIGGLLIFLWPGARPSVRAMAMPFHTYFGLMIFIFACATALAGITEKMFCQDEYKFMSAKGIVANCLGLSIILYGCLVGFVVSQNAYRRRPLPEDKVLLARSTST